jgi:hypothetical protein
LQESEDKLRHVYVTDVLKLIAENAQKAAVPGVGVIDVGATLSKRWIDLTQPEKQEPEKPEDTRSCREITDDIWARIRGSKK